MDLAGVESLREGGAAAFDDLYAAYFDRVFGFVRRRVRDRGDAEDLAQEVFLAVFRGIDVFEGRAALDSWIFGIARNVVHGHLRRTARREARDLDAGGPAPPPSSPPTPEEEVSAQRLAEALRSQLADLGAWSARIFELRYVERAPVREIARRTGSSRHAVHAALEELRRRVLLDAGAD